MQANLPSPDPDFAEASDVCAHLLEITRRAYMERNFDLMGDRAYFPHTLGSFEGEHIMRDRHDLKRVFNHMRDLYDRLGVIDIDRRTLAATFESEDEVHATFVSRYILPGYVMGDEIIGHVTARRIAGRWYFGDGNYATNIGEVMQAFRRSQDTTPAAAPVDP